MTDKRDCTICNVRMIKIGRLETEGYFSGNNEYLFQCPKCKTVVKLIEVYDFNIKDYIWMEE